MITMRIINEWFFKRCNKIKNVEDHLKSENFVKNTENELTSKTINQIKNVAQEEKIKPEVQTQFLKQLEQNHLNH